MKRSCLGAACMSCLELLLLHDSVRAVSSKGLFEALKKRQRVESQSHGTPFLPSSVADHEVKAIAGAKVAQLEASAAAFSSPSVALCLLSVPILVLFHPL